MPAALRHLVNLEKFGKDVLTVLAFWPDDGRFYKVEVLDCDQASRTCRVRFEDNTEFRVPAKDMHIQLALDLKQIGEEQIVCSVCNDDQSLTPNEIVMCDCCNQGYHIACHQPTIDREHANLEDEEAEWLCATCKHLLKTPTPKSGSAKNAAVHQGHAAAVASTTPKRRQKIKVKKVKIPPVTPKQTLQQPATRVPTAVASATALVESASLKAERQANNISTEDFVKGIVDDKKKKNKSPRSKLVVKEIAAAS